MSLNATDREIIADLFEIIEAAEMAQDDLNTCVTFDDMEGVTHTRSVDWLRDNWLRERDAECENRPAIDESLLKAGCLTVNEIRAMRGLPPFMGQDGDARFVPPTEKEDAPDKADDRDWLLQQLKEAQADVARLKGESCPSLTVEKFKGLGIDEQAGFLRKLIELLPTSTLMFLNEYRKAKGLPPLVNEISHIGEASSYNDISEAVTRFKEDVARNQMLAWQVINDARKAKGLPLLVANILPQNTTAGEQFKATTRFKVPLDKQDDIPIIFGSDKTLPLAHPRFTWMYAESLRVVEKHSDHVVIDVEFYPARHIMTTNAREINKCNWEVIKSDAQVSHFGGIPTLATVEAPQWLREAIAKDVTPQCLKDKDAIAKNKQDLALTGQPTDSTVAYHTVVGTHGDHHGNAIPVKVGETLFLIPFGYDDVSRVQRECKRLAEVLNSSECPPTIILPPGTMVQAVKVPQQVPGLPEVKIGDKVRCVNGKYVDPTILTIEAIKGHEAWVSWVDRDNRNRTSTYELTALRKV